MSDDKWNLSKMTWSLPPEKECQTCAGLASIGNYKTSDLWKRELEKIWVAMEYGVESISVKLDDDEPA